MNKEVLYFLRELAGEVDYYKRKFKGHAQISDEARRLLEILGRELLEKEMK